MLFFLGLLFLLGTSVAAFPLHPPDDPDLGEVELTIERHFGCWTPKPGVNIALLMPCRLNLTFDRLMESGFLL